MSTNLIALILFLLCGVIVVKIWSDAAKKINNRPKQIDFDEADIYHPEFKNYDEINCN